MYPAMSNDRSGFLPLRLRSGCGMTNKWGMRNMHHGRASYPRPVSSKMEKAQPRGARAYGMGGNTPADWVTAQQLWAGTVSPLHAWARSAFNIPVSRYNHTLG